MTERLCECFGDSGLHASTHVSGGRLCCDMCGWPIYRRWHFKFVLDWRDLWVGAFWDQQNQKLYILPLPCIGIVLNFGDNP
jgi:hypothetical protein